MNSSSPGSLGCHSTWQVTLPPQFSHFRQPTKLVRTHSLGRTKARSIYKRTKNMRALQLLLGHTKLESTVRYLGIEVGAALEISEQAEI